VSTLPAWNNRNLSKLCDNISSQLIFAHVRAASPNSVVSEANCHPFAYKQYLFMHNGHIASFGKIKRKIIQDLDEDVFQAIQGSTDSEHAFALFLNGLKDRNARASSQEMLDALRKCVDKIVKIIQDSGVSGHSYLNFVVSDGNTVAACRIIHDPPPVGDRSAPASPRSSFIQRSAASLYFSSGTSFKSYGRGVYKMAQRDRREEVVILASERLTNVKEDWVEVPENSYVLVTRSNNVQIIPQY
jgi:glutamine amidotransferase